MIILPCHRKERCDITGERLEMLKTMKRRSYDANEPMIKKRLCGVSKSPFKRNVYTKILLQFFAN